MGKNLVKEKLLNKINGDFECNGRISRDLGAQVKDEFEAIFNCLIDYQPDHFGLEYTNEDTLFIFAKVKEWDIHIETSFEEEVFCTLSVFESNEIALNMSDTTENCIYRLFKLLEPPAFYQEFHSNL